MRNKTFSYFGGRSSTAAVSCSSWDELGSGQPADRVYAVLHRLEDVTRYRAADLYQRGFRSLCGYAGSRPLRGGGEDAGAIAE